MGEIGVVMAFFNLFIASPAWLLALAPAVAMPIVIHLIARRTSRPVMFPGTRFVLIAAQSTRRRRRLRDVALVTLRILALGLAVLAMAGPAWRSSTATASPAGVPSSSGGGRLVVMVLDATASMSRHSGGQSLFDRAVELARQRLDKLDPRTDLASVVLLDRQPASLLSEPTGNLDHLSSLLSSLTCAQTSGDPAEALRVAGDQIRIGRTLAKSRQMPQFKAQIVILSDMQKSLASGAMQVPAEAELLTQAVGSSEANVALSQAQVTPVRPIVGRPASFTCTATLLAPADASPVRHTVEFRTGGQTQSRDLQLKPGSPARVRFMWTPSAVGPVDVTATLAAGRDALNLDDTVGLFVDVRAAMPVTWVTTQSPSDPGGATYYLDRALRAMPRDPAERSPVSAVALSVVHDIPASAGRGDIVMIGPRTAPGPRLPQDRIAQSLERGAAVIWLLTGPPDVQDLHSFLDDHATDSPLRVWLGRGRWEATPTRFGSAQFEDASLLAFDGPSRTALLETVIAGHQGGASSADLDAPLIYSDGSPVLVRQSIGAGRLVVINAGLEPGATDWTRRPTFVPWLRGVVESLQEAAGPAPDVHPGDSATLDLAGAKPSLSLERIDPDDRRAPLDVRETGRVDMGILPTVGRYLVESNGRTVGGVRVNLDPAESDLRTAELLQGPATNSSAPDRADLQLGIRSAGAGEPDDRPLSLWPWMVFCAAAFLCVECLVLWMKPAPTGKGVGHA